MELVQIEMLEDLDYGSWYYPKGEFIWLDEEEAEACVKLGAAKIISQ